MIQQFKNYTSLMILVTMTLTSFSVLANYNSDVYEMNSNRKTLLYKSKMVETEKDGIRETKNTYVDPSDAFVLEETAQMKGSTLIRYEMEQKQIGAKASVEVKGDEIIFEKTQDGKTKKESEKFKSTLVISSNFTPFVKDHWQEILDGKTVSFRYAAWERMETVGFDIKKIGQETIDGKPVIQIKMSASSFVIAAIVNPIFFKYSADGSFLVEMKGRVAPKKKVDSSWKDLDAEVIYQNF